MAITPVKAPKVFLPRRLLVLALLLPETGFPSEGRNAALGRQRERDRDRNDDEDGQCGPVCMSCVSELEVVHQSIIPQVNLT